MGHFDWKQITEEVTEICDASEVERSFSICANTHIPPKLTESTELELYWRGCYMCALSTIHPLHIKGLTYLAILHSSRRLN